MFSRRVPKIFRREIIDEERWRLGRLTSPASCIFQRADFKLGSTVGL